MFPTESPEYFALEERYYDLFGCYPLFNNDGMHTEEGIFAVVKKCVETKTPISEEEYNCTYHPEKKKS